MSRVENLRSILQRAEKLKVEAEALGVMLDVSMHNLDEDTFCYLADRGTMKHFTTPHRFTSARCGPLPIFCEEAPQ